MARNRVAGFSLIGVYVTGLFLTIILCSTSVKTMLSNESAIVGIYILVIVLICHYCVPPNFKLKNWSYWVLFGIQFLLAITLSLQGLAGMTLVLVYNIMNILSQKWYHRNLLLISTQTIQDHYHERQIYKISLLDFLQIPVIVVLFYFAYILSDTVFDNEIVKLPLFINDNLILNL